MECLGPRCAAMILDWMRSQREPSAELPAPKGTRADSPGVPGRQGLLWGSVAYQDDAPAIRSESELAGAIEHLQYAVFRRYQNQLTKAERARLDNTIQNALFKIDRYAERLDPSDRSRVEDECRGLRDQVRDGRELADKLRLQGRRAELKLSQLASLTPEGFEEFVGEVFEALGFEVEHVGGTGDQGVDLKVCRAGLVGIVQCKYFSRGVVGSPELAEVPRHDPPHAEPQGVLRHDEDVHARGRQVRQRAPDRAHRRPQAGRAGPGGDGPRLPQGARAGLVLSRPGRDRRARFAHRGAWSGGAGRCGNESLDWGGTRGIAWAVARGERNRPSDRDRTSHPAKEGTGMAACKNDASLNELDLPAEFEDLEGLLRADLRAVVAMLAQRANERLLLTRREHSQLRSKLWNNLTAAVNAAVEPLSAERR